MDLREYYNLPEGSNVSLKYLVVTDTIPNDIPLLTDCKYLYAYKLINAVPHILTDNVTNMSYMFYNCTPLKYVNLSKFNTSNVTDMSSMFNGCGNLLEVKFECDTSKVKTMDYMFDGCNKLQKISALDCGGITAKNNYPFQTYSTSTYYYLTDVGGFLNMKMSWDENYGLAMCMNLTRESCINILNGLYDFTGNGETPNSSQGKLKVHANFLNLVGDDISIAINKGWTVTS